jgi:spore germination cell wall hydrolase CwlJ-like protein
MVASRNRPKGACIGPFGLSVLALSLVPSQIGYQDLAALLVRQQDVSQRARAYALASPFGTIHAATFSFPRPIGTLMPQPPVVRLVSLNTGDPDVTGSVLPELPPGGETGPLQYPVVNRRLKGDLLMPRPRPPQPQPEGTRDLAPGKVKTVSFPRPAEAAAAAEAAPSLPKIEPLDPVDDDNAVRRLGRLYFGSVPVGKNIGPIERWPGEDPIIMAARPADPDLKPAAPAAHGGDAKAGETVAAKGEVTGPGQRPKSPAERLGLNVKERTKAEKCLAEAVYFESRGETKRGQIAVAQVVMNRVFSGYYPTNVCGVVYQNAHRYNACQFTFACDRVRDVVTEPDMWDQARQIARDMLDGKLWLSDIGKSTHYHAYWVHPWWVGTMRKLSRIGVHTFYRPKRWGDGADAPTWGAGITPQNAKL